MEMAHDDAAPDAPASEHPAVAKFRETMRKLGAAGPLGADIAREQRERLRRSRLALKAEVDCMLDEAQPTDEPGDESIARVPA